MALWRAMGNVVAISLVNLNVATCRSTAGEGGAEAESTPAPKVIQLEGVDTSKLTAREKRDWSSYVSEQLAPCADQPVSIAQCVQESRSCSTCIPAAQFLATQVTRGRSRTQVEMAYRIRFSPDELKTVDVADSPSLGPADAPVTIVEWADFECPFCGAAAPVLDKVVRRFPGNVRLVFKCYPLSSHEHAEIAARAAVAAGRQNKFWEMHHALFEHQNDGLDRDTVERLASDLGLDMKQFKTDIESEATADVVMADRKQAEALGLRGTPMIYINGRPFDLELFSLVEDLDSWIQLDVRERTGKSVSPREVADAPGPPQASASAAPGLSASAVAAPSASAPAPVASGKTR